MAAELDLERALVIGVASSALFDLEESDAVFREQGEERYREYQRDHLDDVLEPGVAFPFIRRLLDLNDLSDCERLVEVVILSRNDPETGMRVMRSVERHGLDITRAIFMQGRAPYRFMKPLRMSLFLSANEADVREAISLGFAAGRVVGRAVPDVDDPQGYRRRVRVAVVTARSAPAHERAINSIRQWGLRVNDAFFLGGLPKGPMLEVLQPHIFFDDQRRHVEGAALSTPSVHIPFGEINRE